MFALDDPKSDLLKRVKDDETRDYASWAKAEIAAGRDPEQAIVESDPQ